MKPVTPVSRDWLRKLHGQHVGVRIDLFGVMAETRGWAIVDDESFGVNHLRDVGFREPRCGDPDDLVSFALNECAPAVDDYGWLVFHRAGWKVGHVGVLLETRGGASDGQRYYGPPARAWKPEPAGTRVQIRDYGAELLEREGASR